MTFVSVALCSTSVRVRLYALEGMDPSAQADAGIEDGLRDLHFVHGGLAEFRFPEMAEGEGFEPPEPFGSTVFKTAAFDHSATPPVLISLDFLP